MVLYLAGPMRGREAFGKAMFDAEAMRLRRVGYEVVSPAELDEEAGWDLETMTEADLPADWRRQVLRQDALAIAGSDGVALLPDWSASEGVTLELACARFVGIPVQEVQTWLDDALIHREEAEDVQAAP